jgi:hypothetical protein
MEDFVGVYDNALPKEDCKFIIDWFESSADLHEIGKSAVGINKKVKDSTDIACVMNSNISISKWIHKALHLSFKDYVKRYKILDNIEKFALDPGYNVQRYYPNQGYFREHCENAGGPHKDSKRVLAWTLYLNDVTDGGGTRYTLLNKTVDAVEGRLVLFPAYWTHAHHGIVSPTQTKYIATGWFASL